MNQWPDEVAAGAVLRAGARVLLIDEQDRLLLFRHTDGGENFWCPVGGAIEPGESAEQAAQREIVEETGFTAPIALVDIARRRVVVPLFGQLTDSREHWFLARVAHRDISRSGWSPLEHETISAFRSWTVAELASSSERLVPADLARVLDGLLRDGAPIAPFTLGR